MRLLSSSCGNDSVAMLIKAQRDGLDDLTVVYCHTGWAAASWTARIQEVKDFCELVAGVPFVELQPPRDFSTLMRERKGFPMPGKTWCSFWLKALPFLEYADQVDPGCEATVMIGKRRDANRADMRALTEPEVRRTIDLETEVGQNMFRPYHHMGAEGFAQVIQWARSPRGKYEPPEAPGATCTEGYCE